MAIFFTADTHFGYNKVAKLRGFDNTSDMNEILIANWNSVVTDKDEIYVLGDFSNMNLSDTSDIVERLNGKKYYIRGNHDEWIDEYEKKYGHHTLRSVNIHEYMKVSHDDITAILFHFPIRTWMGKGKKNIHLHGHTHFDQYGELSYNVGIDINNFHPIKFHDILEKINYHAIYKEYINNKNKAE